MLFINVTVFTVENEKDINVNPKLELTITDAFADVLGCGVTGTPYFDGSYQIDMGQYCFDGRGKICGFEEKCVIVNYGATDCQDINCP